MLGGHKSSSKVVTDAINFLGFPKNYNDYSPQKVLSIPSIYHLFFQLRAKFALKVCIHKYNIFFSRTLSAMFLLPSLS